MTLLNSCSRVASFVLLGAMNAQAQATPSHPSVALSAEQMHQLDLALEQIRVRFHIPGLAVGIVENGLPVYSRGFGVRDVATKAPVTPETLFHAASISKTLTATAVLQLVEQGRLSLDDPLERHLPAFKDSGITLEQLLTHSAGLSDRDRATGATEAASVNDYIARVAQHDLAYPPGQGWEYSDADYNVLGAVIEAVSGDSFANHMTAKVLAVASMTSSTFDRPLDTAEIAWPHIGELFVRRAARHPWDRVFLPSSGLQTNVTDLMRWASVNLDRDPTLLAPASYEALFTRQLDTSWSGVSMGLGWQLEQRDSKWLPRHPGGDRGFRALLTLYPAERRAIVILSNGETTPRWEIRGIIEAVLEGESVQLPEPPATLTYRWLIVLAPLCLIAIVTFIWYRRRTRSQRKARTLTAF